MSDDPQNETRKRILFLCFALGSMAGIGLYLVFKAVQNENFILLVVLLPMAIASVPLARALVRLQRDRRSTG